MTTSAAAPGLVCSDSRLLQMIERMRTASLPDELAETGKECLGSVIALDYFGLLLYDSSAGSFRPAGDKIHQFQIGDIESAVKYVLETQKVVSEESKAPTNVDRPRTEAIGSFALIPLTTALLEETCGKIGVLAIGSRSQRFTPAQIDWITLVFARHLAAAAEHVLALEERDRVSHDRDTARIMYEVARTLVRPCEISDIFVELSTILHPFLQPDYVGLAMREREAGRLRLFVMDFPEGKAVMREEKLMTGGPWLPGTNFGSPILIRSLADGGVPSDLSRLLLAEGLNSACFLPLAGSVGALGTLGFGSIRAGAFSAHHAQALGELAPVVATAIENANGRQRVSRLRGAEAPLERMERSPSVREMVGAGSGLRSVIETIRLVAPTDATVLLLGETGTGKEMLARAVHEMSERRERNFVTMNCTAIPAGLLESELFGYEKGAFTGALAARPGRFELAHQGTLFLDEVGDIPLELQPKLLRVLQESEFERLGSSRTMRVNVRIVAATNRDLRQMTREGRFRSDLFYRLNVIPVRVPSLRERSGDIPALVSYFLRKYAERFRRREVSIEPSTLEKLRKYSWPGNVRELENLIERSVILSQGHTLELPPGEPEGQETLDEGNRLKNLENEMIRRALSETNGVIGGPNGAAARLGIKRSTLQSKLKKLK